VVSSYCISYSKLHTVQWLATSKCCWMTWKCDSVTSTNIHSHQPVLFKLHCTDTHRVCFCHVTTGHYWWLFSFYAHYCIKTLLNFRNMLTVPTYCALILLEPCNPDFMNCKLLHHFLPHWEQSYRFLFFYTFYFSSYDTIWDGQTDGWMDRQDPYCNLLQWLHKITTVLFFISMRQSDICRKWHTMKYLHLAETKRPFTRISVLFMFHSSLLLCS